MHQVLARKWRPKTFAEVVGQEHVLRALTNALEQKRLHHAYLFTGTRGVGKTTIARILAKCLNCNTALTSVPCCSCDACTEIDSGRFIDLLEVDAASRTKVEDTRDLLDNVQYLPVAGRYKIYIIDEVHMLSNHSFNALLKTLEEPPSHVKFLLATTDPQKLPITILSRCLQFNLKKISPDYIKIQLEKILAEEKIAFENNALSRLALAADGSMRDALSLLDQVIAYGNGIVKNSDVCTMLGSIENSYVLQILEALAAKNANYILNTVAQLADFAVDFTDVLNELLIFLHKLAIAKLYPNTIERLFENMQLAKDFVTKFSDDEIQLYYQIGLIGKRDLPLSPTQKIGFEMIMLRMLAFRPQNSNISINNNLPSTYAENNHKTKEQQNKLEDIKIVDKFIEGPANKSEQFNITSRRNEQASVLYEIHGKERKLNQGYEIKHEEHIYSSQTEPQSATEIDPSSLEVPQNDKYTANEKTIGIIEDDNLKIGDNNNNDIISSMISQLKLSGPTAILLKHCMVDSIVENNINLFITSQQAPLLNKNARDRICCAFSKFFGKTMHVEIMIGSSNIVTSAKIEQSKYNQQQENILKTLTEDLNVQKIINAFDAQLIINS